MHDRWCGPSDDQREQREYEPDHLDFRLVGIALRVRASGGRTREAIPCAGSAGSGSSRAYRGIFWRAATFLRDGRVPSDVGH